VWHGSIIIFPGLHHCYTTTTTINDQCQAPGAKPPMLSYLTTSLALSSHCQQNPAQYTATKCTSCCRQQQGREHRNDHMHLLLNYGWCFRSSTKACCHMLLLLTGASTSSAEKSSPIASSSSICNDDLHTQPFTNWAAAAQIPLEFCGMRQSMLHILLT
jgi:hypothetical protein